MAIRSIAQTDSLEEFRQQFNQMTANDFGDIATLDPALSATTVIGAVNELSAAVSSGQAFFIEDASSTVQQVASGQTLKFRGTSNQLNAVVSVPDTMTISLAANVTIPNNLTVTNNANVNNDLVVANQANIDGTLTITTGQIIDTTGQISFGDENLTTTGTMTAGTLTGSSLVSSGAVSGTTITASSALQGTNLELTSGGIVFEGATADGFETTLTPTDPTADHTITLPNITGTLITTGDTGTVTSDMILNSTIQNEDIANSTIRATKLNLSADTLIVDTLQANAITGTASIAQLVSLTANNTANETVFLTFADGATGNQGLETDTDLNYNPSTNVLNVTATAANYADLAEMYETDKEYGIGTIVMFGGEKEITIADLKTKKVAGVVSEHPAYLMNKNCENGLAIALQGRVKCRVKGNIRKGDMIVVGEEMGIGVAENNPQCGMVVGKALQDYNSDAEGMIEVVVGRL
tara:strand:+ start:853 stop:2256 length:1404 start_codon:yes stop_codon:yes gene_type:complete